MWAYRIVCKQLQMNVNYKLRVPCDPSATLSCSHLPVVLFPYLSVGVTVGVWQETGEGQQVKCNLPPLKQSLLFPSL